MMESVALPMSKDDDLIKKILDSFVSRGGYTEVKANIDGFETPSALSNKESEDRVVPDITALKRNGRWYIEVVRKDGEVERTVSKWKLLSMLGKARNGGLILMAPSGQYAFAERLTKKHDIHCKIVKM
ncbi:MAG: hypothetical protein IPP15_03950 [Saprospiraceae bacterium]|uniref:Uncharacterized protein n=1 Tax=Candidatus Opimibacter skivensis TaxID=2982028 RepID=A0A9D7ST01_9BACT|nr:hypothetical protein [Candidatus Opimibacter skivensis]